MSKSLDEFYPDNVAWVDIYYPDNFVWVDIYKDREPQISSAQLSEMKSWLLQRLEQLEESKDEPKVD